MGVHNPFVGCLLAIIVNILLIYLVFSLIRKTFVNVIHIQCKRNGKRDSSYLSSGPLIIDNFRFAFGAFRFVVGM